MKTFKEKGHFIIFILPLFAFVISLSLILYWNSLVGVILLLVDAFFGDTPIIKKLLILTQSVLSGYVLVEMFDWSIIGAYFLTFLIPILIIASSTLLSAAKKSERY